MREQAYIYNADIYCQHHGEHLKFQLDAAGKRPLGYPDERTYDSDQYPKGPYENGGGEADSFQHCAKCGKFLENDLTQAGVEYTIDCLAENRGRPTGKSDVLDIWANELKEYSLTSGQRQVVNLYLERRKNPN